MTQGEVTEIDDRARDGRRSRSHVVEEAPLAQAPRPVSMHEVTVRNVARKRGAVQQEDPGAPAREQHRQRRTCTPCADDQRVVHESCPRSLPRVE